MYKLNPACFPVQGFGRSIIYNFIKCTYLFIPNDLYSLLVKHTTTKQWLSEKFSDNQRSIVLDYIKFLINNDCLIDCTTINSKRIPEISQHWSSSSIISTLNIQIKGQDNNINVALQNFCLNNHVKNVSIECSCKLSILSKYLNSISNTFVDNVELYLQYAMYQNTKFEKLLQSYPFISKIV
jgi:hypothetical protein